MNDEFLRRLRPTPRAAFVHELKARLDRQPRERAVGSGPTYLRPLLIALLIGGAAFAVTMMSMRRESGVGRVNAPVSQDSRAVEKARAIVPSPGEVKSKSGEVRSAITRDTRRNSAPPAMELAPDARETPPTRASATATAPGAAAPPSPIVTGIAGAGVRFIEGAGGTFPFRIYQEWSDQYWDRSRVRVDYSTVGSGGGLKLLLNRSVTFAATDNPMTEAELKTSGLFQFPIVASGVVPIVRLDGVTTSRIKLDGWTLARIYLGEISYWNDSSIQKVNPGLVLPATRITLAYRQDDAASTQVLTEYLSRYNSSFRSTRQMDVSPGAAASSDDGMAELVARTHGAIGYVDYFYARQHGVESIRLINREGGAVSATPESLQSALAHADSLGAAGFGASLVDLPGAQAWPMANASFVVMQSRGSPPQAAAAVQFFDWVYSNGAQAATRLGYVPVPPAAADRIRESWAVAFGKAAP